MKLYTVWYRFVHVTKGKSTREGPWVRENVTRCCRYHKVLSDSTSYMFAVTAWNRWGESLSEQKETLFISTEFLVKKTENGTNIMPTIPVHKGKLPSYNYVNLLRILISTWQKNVKVCYLRCCIVVSGFCCCFLCFFPVFVHLGPVLSWLDSLGYLYRASEQKHKCVSALARKFLYSVTTRLHPSPSPHETNADTDRIFAIWKVM